MASTTDRWAQAHELALAQHGLVARWQLCCLGLTNTGIRGHRQRQGWRTVHPGVYALPAAPDTWQRRGAAALLLLSQPTSAPVRAAAIRDRGAAPLVALRAAAFSGRAVLTGRIAAHALELLARLPKVIDVHVARDHHPTRRPDLLVLRNGLIPAREVKRSGGLPLACVPRTVRDLATLAHRGLVSASDLEATVVAADARHRIRPQQLLTSIDGIAFEGRAVLVPMLEAFCGELSHSPDEATARRLARRAAATLGLVVADRPMPIRLRGRIVAEADIAVPAIRYDIEVDGRHHELRHQRSKDRLRDRLAAQARWTVERFTAREVREDADGFVAAITATMERLLARASG